jgi:hypothetical protein
VQSKRNYQLPELLLPELLLPELLLPELLLPEMVEPFHPYQLLRFSTVRR